MSLLLGLLGLGLALGFFYRAQKLGLAQGNTMKSPVFYGLGLLLALILTFFYKENCFEKGIFLCLVLGQVLWMAYTDYKTGYFYNFDLYLLAGLSGMHFFLKPSCRVFMASSLAFLFFYATEKLTRGFGEGDKYFVFLTSLFFSSPWDIYHYLSTSFIVAGGIAGFFYLVGKWDRKKEVPLGPFLGLIFVCLYFYKEVL